MSTLLISEYGEKMLYKYSWKLQKMFDLKTIFYGKLSYKLAQQQASYNLLD